MLNFFRNNNDVCYFLRVGFVFCIGCETTVYELSNGLGGVFNFHFRAGLKVGLLRDWSNDMLVLRVVVGFKELGFMW